MTDQNQPPPNTPQPPPQLGTAPATWDLVLADIRERDAAGATFSTGAGSLLTAHRRSSSTARSATISTR